MKGILLAIALFLIPTTVWAQGCGPNNPNCVVSTPAATDSSNRAANTSWVNLWALTQFPNVNPDPGTFGSSTRCPTITANTKGQITAISDVLCAFSAGGSSGQIQYNNSGAFAGFTMGGDCTLVTSTGVITCTKTNGTAFGALATVTPGTGVAAALGINIGSAGAPVLFNGAGGTPSSLTLTNATGLPISTGVSGLGSNVNSALQNTLNASSGLISFNGVLGTVQAGSILTNATGLPISTGVSGLGTGVATSAALAVNTASGFVTVNGVLGTPVSGTLTNETGLPISTGVSGLGTGVATALAVNTGSAGSFADTSGPTSWTPVLTAATPGNLNVVYGTQAGRYYKAGKMVVATFTVVTTTFTYTTASGNIEVTGLPFAGNSTANTSFEGTMSFAGWTRASYTHMVPVITPGASLLTFNVSGSGQGTGAEVITNFPTGGTVTLQGTITYFTD